MHKEGQRQGSDRHTEAMEVITSGIGKHIRHKKHHGYVDKHDNHFKERIFPITVGINCLNHPTVDEDDQSHQIDKKGIGG